jgi:hypothetical protein
MDSPADRADAVLKRLPPDIRALLGKLKPVLAAQGAVQKRTDRRCTTYYRLRFRFDDQTAGGARHHSISLGSDQQMALTIRDLLAIWRCERPADSAGSTGTAAPADDGPQAGDQNAESARQDAANAVREYIRHAMPRGRARKRLLDEALQVFTSGSPIDRLQLGFKLPQRVNQRGSPGRPPKNRFW